MTVASFEIVGDSANRSRWLSERRMSVGASESAAVLGLGAWGSALELWAEKTGRVERDDLAASEPVFWGNMLEEGIIRGYGARTGRQAVPFGLMLRSTRWPWMTCTPDALTAECDSHRELSDIADAVSYLRDMADVSAANFDPLTETDHGQLLLRAIRDGRWWPLQTKNIGFGSAEHWQNGVPVYYRIQCAHEALVCGARRVTGAALIAGQKLAWDDLEVDADAGGILERQIVNLTRAFVRDHLETGIAPAADASESARRALAKLYPLAEPGKRVALGAALMERAYELDSAKDALKAAQERVTAIENEIKQSMGDAESAVFPDGSGYTLKTQTRAAVTTAASTFRVLRRKQARGEQ